MYVLLQSKFVNQEFAKFRGSQISWVPNFVGPKFRGSIFVGHFSWVNFRGSIFVGQFSWVDFRGSFFVGNFS